MLASEALPPPPEAPPPPEPLEERGEDKKRRKLLALKEKPELSDLEKMKLGARSIGTEEPQWKELGSLTAALLKEEEEGEARTRETERLLQVLDLELMLLKRNVRKMGNYMRDEMLEPIEDACKALDLKVPALWIENPNQVTKKTLPLHKDTFYRWEAAEQSKALKETLKAICVRYQQLPVEELHDVKTAMHSRLVRLRHLTDKRDLLYKEVDQSLPPLSIKELDQEEAWEFYRFSGFRYHSNMNSVFKEAEEQASLRVLGWQTFWSLAQDLLLYTDSETGELKISPRYHSQSGEDNLMLLNVGAEVIEVFAYQDKDTNVWYEQEPFSLKFHQTEAVMGRVGGVTSLVWDQSMAPSFH